MTTLSRPDNKATVARECPCYLHRRPPMPLNMAGPCVCECDHEISTTPGSQIGGGADA